jgi:hypothetical protein
VAIFKKSGAERAAPVQQAAEPTPTRTVEPAPTRATKPVPVLRSGATPGALLFPVGHYLGVNNRLDATAPQQQVRRGATFHGLTEEHYAIWAAAHGTAEAIENDVPWQRQSIAAHPRVIGLARVDELIDELLGMGLLVEAAPGTDQALAFARSHRLVPLMLGLGNSGRKPGVFGIGFLRQPVVEVSFGIYDLWQWSSMDDSLWATCENSAEVARRSKVESLDPVELLTGFLPTLHALLLANAACLDTYFRLRWPEGVLAGSTGSSVIGGV